MRSMFITLSFARFFNSFMCCDLFTSRILLKNVNQITNQSIQSRFNRTSCRNFQKKNDISGNCKHIWNFFFILFYYQWNSCVCTHCISILKNLLHNSSGMKVTVGSTWKKLITHFKIGDWRFWFDFWFWKIKAALTAHTHSFQDQ